MIRKSIAYLCLILFLTSCNLLFKQTVVIDERSDLDNLIYYDVSILKQDKNSIDNGQYILSLEQAYAKAKSRDSIRLKSLIQESKKANVKNIYEIYVALDKRQEAIKPLLPLKIKSTISVFDIQEKTAKFVFEDYKKVIAYYKEQTLEHLYEASEELLKSKKVKDIRKAYSNLTYINEINPNFKDVSTLRKEAEKRGLEYVLVDIDISNTVVFPDSIKIDFWDFCNFRMPKWIKYHNHKINGLEYDYKMVISVLKMTITKEELSDVTFKNERLVKDGMKKLLDPAGNVVKSTTGKEIMTDNYKKVSSEITEYQQLMSCSIIGKIEYTDIHEGRVIKSFPIKGEYNFTNTYATYVGDRNAIYEEYQYFFDKTAVTFPNKDQMGYAASIDFKNQIKSIVTRKDLFN